MKYIAGLLLTVMATASFAVDDYKIYAKMGVDAYKDKQYEIAERNLALAVWGPSTDKSPYVPGRIDAYLKSNDIFVDDMDEERLEALRVLLNVYVETGRPQMVIPLAAKHLPEDEVFLRACRAIEQTGGYGLAHTCYGQLGDFDRQRNVVRRSAVRDYYGR